MGIAQCLNILLHTALPRSVSRLPLIGMLWLVGKAFRLALYVSGPGRR